MNPDPPPNKYGLLYTFFSPFPFFIYFLFCEWVFTRHPRHEEPVWCGGGHVGRDPLLMIYHIPHHFPFVLSFELCAVPSTYRPENGLYRAATMGVPYISRKTKRNAVMLDAWEMPTFPSWSKFERFIRRPSELSIPVPIELLLMSRTYRNRINNVTWCNDGHIPPIISWYGITNSWQDFKTVPYLMVDPRRWALITVSLAGTFEQKTVPLTKHRFRTT